MGNGFNLEDIECYFSFQKTEVGHSIGMDESIDGCGNCMHAMMQRKLYL